MRAHSDGVAAIERIEPAAYLPLQLGQKLYFVLDK